MARGFNSESRPKKQELPDVRLQVTVKAATEKALLAVVKDGGEHWLPRSQIRSESKVSKKGDVGLLVVSGWIAGEKGLGPTREEAAQQAEDEDDTGVDYSE